jgi:hypothetical protein
MHVFGPYRLMLAAAAIALSQQASAQPIPGPQGQAPNVVQFLYNDANGTPICNGPRGAAPCAVIQQWINGGGLNAPPRPAYPPPEPAPGSPPVTGGGVPQATDQGGAPNMVNPCQISLPTCPY